MSTLGNIPVFHDDPDPLQAAAMVENVEVEPSNVDTHVRGRLLLVAGPALALAEGIAAVEPAGEAERATAKLETSAPWGKDKAV